MKQKLIKEARFYLGVQEGEPSHQKLIQQYNKIRPYPVGYQMKISDDWCAAFITVIADATNCSQYIGRECGVHRFVQLFKKKGIWLGLKKPEAGDLIVFDWQKNGWLDHIGLVESFDGKKVTTIEGNRSNAVRRKKYTWNNWQIAGYARFKGPVKADDGKEKDILIDLAGEVIAGKWGNGRIRVERLTQAGYNPKIIQEKVNQLLK
ncbi:MAG: CHAP domain-containing protein [Atopostipes suicloacalis]|nr:CHAP domain-containing protein [Atopostipes suicloacalis]MDN6730999.1 CHAP domain-containing protein [Atopostipes suicloacalis]